MLLKCSFFYQQHWQSSASFLCLPLICPVESHDTAKCCQTWVVTHYWSLHGMIREMCSLRAQEIFQQTSRMSASVIHRTFHWGIFIYSAEFIPVLKEKRKVSPFFCSKSSLLAGDFLYLPLKITFGISL